MVGGLTVWIHPDRYIYSVEEERHTEEESSIPGKCYGCKKEINVFAETGCQETDGI